MVLAGLRDERCGKSQEAIAEDRRGKYSAEHLFELDHAVRTWDHHQVLIAECNRKLKEHGETFAKKDDRKDIPPAASPARDNSSSQAAMTLKRRRRRSVR